MGGKSPHFVLHVSPSIFGLFWKKVSHYTQHPFKNVVEYFILFYTDIYGETCITVLSVFLFGYNPKNIFLCRDLTFKLRLGIHLIKTSEKLVYYHLYHEEASFYLGVYIQLFNRPFIVFNKNTIFIQLSLSSQGDIMIQHNLFCSFTQHMI